ncbi:MAG: tetratricopeptide repeat protein [Solirubrobacteraceae bacterium]|nr:tetratricopeptide repeat protein [Solirubrobacteraceae bacterium]
MFLKRSRSLPESELERLWTARRARNPVAYLELARKARAKYPRDPEALIELAQALSQNERHDEAAEEASLAAGLSVDGAVLVLAAWALIHAERIAEAGAVLDRVLAADPQNPVVENEALYLRGATYGWLGDALLAEKYLRDAVARDDQRPLYLSGLARFLLRHDRRQEALELVTTAEHIADDEDRAEALRELHLMGLG